jgi:hypothetical protein
MKIIFSHIQTQIYEYAKNYNQLTLCTFVILALDVTCYNI